MCVYRHADGSIKFWDASAGTLQILYKLKTAKVFDRVRPQSLDSETEDPFAVQLISLCPESRKLCCAGSASYVVLFKFKKTEAVTETTVCIFHLTSLPPIQTYFFYRLWKYL